MPWAGLGMAAQREGAATVGEVIEKEKNTLVVNTLPKYCLKKSSSGVMYVLQ